MVSTGQMIPLRPNEDRPPEVRVVGQFVKAEEGDLQGQRDA